MPRSLLTLTVSALLASVSHAAQVDSGVYWPTTRETSQKVVAQDGKQVYLGEKCDLKIQKAELVSRDNANDAFRLWLTVPYDARLESSYGTLIVDGMAYRQTGSGIFQKKTCSLEFPISGRDRAEQVAEYFAVQPYLREHPRHCLEVSFVPAKKAFAPGEEVRVALRIRNVGQTAVAFKKGGRNRAQRDNQYVFSARYQGRQVKDVGTSDHAGGLATRQVIKPGRVFEDQVNLAKWFSFDKPGVYEVLGSYYMEFFNPEDESWRTIWEDYATADFLVRVAGKR